MEANTHCYNDESLSLNNCVSRASLLQIIQATFCVRHFLNAITAIKVACFIVASRIAKAIGQPRLDAALGAVGEVPTQKHLLRVSIRDVIDGYKPCVRLRGRESRKVKWAG